MTNEEILVKAQKYVTQERNETFRKEVEKLIADKNFDELSERFYKDLEFGTGGLRGIIGGGYNRLNSYTIQKATQGLANYITRQKIEDPSAVIAYDSRNYSDLFAADAARVLAGNGIKTYLFSSLRPTPELSFAVRQLKATTGIVVTASHNPAKYNGYKVYWSDGCQVTPPHDDAIVELANKVETIKIADKDENIVYIDEEIDRKYIDMVKNLSIRPDLIKEKGKSVKVVYTPLHGSGKMPVSRALSEMGIDVIWVEEQKEPDGNFSTVKKPNPEEKEALQLSLDLGKKVGADLILATDPDADRLGIAVPDENGEFVLVTGNQLGALLSDYIFSSKKNLGALPAKPAFIKTIVTTNLQKKIADFYGAATFDVLTGFKYIGEKIREFETGTEGYEYLFGGEESYGYLIGTSVRDKDAVSAAVMTAEMTLFHRSQGRSILQQLRNLWKQFGFYQETLINLDFEGQAGIAKMDSIMKRLREKIPATINAVKVVEVKDYKTSQVLSSDGKEKAKILLPKSNVLQFILEDETVITARPSGTEPKIKFYASVYSDGEEAAKKKAADFDKAIRTLVG
ncbi:MAG: phospho-sugar mutase [Chitinispirillales bacterium]|jgi:phosphoglucomutase|nr:phospho-sugar mutase [Chitinispirillales bacterium]